MNTAGQAWPRHTASVTLRMAAWLVVLNTPFWILGRGVFVSRALFSLDSLLALMLCQVFPGLGLLFVAFSWLCDLLWSTSLIYHFTSPLTLVHSFRYAGTLNPWPYLTSPFVIYAIPFMVAMVVARKLVKVRIGTTPIVATMLTLLVLDVANGSSALSHMSVRLNGTNVAGSSFYALAAAVRTDDAVAKSVAVAGGAAEFEAVTGGGASADSGILYIIVESMGVHKSARSRSWLLAQLAPAELSAHYHVRSGTLDFRGGTPDSELRRLCGLAGSYRHIDPDDTRNCLPNLLAAKGWRTAGFHGFSEKMFDRRRWWPVIGLQEMYFAEQLAPQFTNRCGAAFKGMCDVDVVRAAASRAAEERTFAYALTLNSHLPLEPTPISDDLALLCSTEHMTDDACALFAHYAVALRAIAFSLSGTSRIHTVMVVGDHAPPFADLPSREQFVRDKVPYYVLIATTSPRPP